MTTTRWITCIATGCLVVAAAVLQWSVFADDDLPKLFVVDGSESNDGLFYCSVDIPKDSPVDSIALILKNREAKKVGEALLGTIEKAPGEKMAVFFLNREMVKHSVVHIHIHPIDDNRHKLLKIVVGEQPALRKKDGKTVRVPIE
jgi:hypothetical protein